MDLEGKWHREGECCGVDLQRAVWEGLPGTKSAGDSRYLIHALAF